MRLSGWSFTHSFRLRNLSWSVVRFLCPLNATRRQQSVLQCASDATRCAMLRCAAQQDRTQNHTRPGKLGRQGGTEVYASVAVQGYPGIKAWPTFSRNTANWKRRTLVTPGRFCEASIPRCTSQCFTSLSPIVRSQ